MQLLIVFEKKTIAEIQDRPLGKLRSGWVNQQLVLEGTYTNIDPRETWTSVPLFSPWFFSVETVVELLHLSTISPKERKSHLIPVLLRFTTQKKKSRSRDVQNVRFCVCVRVLCNNRISLSNFFLSFFFFLLVISLRANKKRRVPCYDLIGQWARRCSLRFSRARKYYTRESLLRSLSFARNRVKRSSFSPRYREPERLADVRNWKKKGKQFACRSSVLAVSRERYARVHATQSTTQKFYIIQRA